MNAKLVLFLLISSCIGFSLQAADKPRVVVLTDISPATVEPDDIESMVRLLVCADLVEIEALVATTGWSLGGGDEHPELIHQAIDAYEKDLPNLMKRSAQTGATSDEVRQRIGYWPSPAYLRSVTMLGSRKRGMDHIGKNNHSPGSDFIIRLADEPDERPIWVLGWGGGNTLAQAIWRVQSERTPEQLRAFLRKLRFYAITDQDRGYEKGTPYEISSHQWMRREFSKDLFFIWDEGAWMFQNGTGKDRWPEYAEHIQNHGNLGAMYPKYRYGVEGDTPSFLYVLPNGLHDPEHPDFGGWGGCYMWGTGPDGKTEAWVNQRGLPSHEASRKHFERFYPATFNSFAARMDWAAKGHGNREPAAIINGDTSNALIKLTPPAGTSVLLDASQSRDPEGDNLRFSWWVLPGVGDDCGTVGLSDLNSSKVTVSIPAEASGKRLHIVCEATDSGSPPLTSYRRIILEPTSQQALPEHKNKLRPRVVVLSDFPPLDVIPVGSGEGPPERRSDPDDVQSMIRFLLYGDEFDIEGLIASSATLANVARKNNIHGILDRYDQVDENLRAHDPRYPTSDRLRSITWQGRDNTWGKPASEIIGEGKDSEASEAIIRLVDAPDARPIWFCVWGGPADLAQALWKVRATRSAAELDRFLGKLRVYLIIKQDGTAEWLMDQFPKLFVILTEKNYLGMFWNAQGSDTRLADLDWVNANIRHGRGSLGSAYPESGANPKTPGVIEGDTPSFLHLVSAVRGLNDPEKPDQPGWGGKFVQRDPDKNHWFDHPSGGKTVWRWRAAVQDDFATRMKWCLPPAKQ